MIKDVYFSCNLQLAFKSSPCDLENVFENFIRKSFNLDTLLIVYVSMFLLVNYSAPREFGGYLNIFFSVRGTGEKVSDSSN